MPDRRTAEPPILALLHVPVLSWRPSLCLFPAMPFSILVLSMLLLHLFQLFISFCFVFSFLVPFCHLSCYSIFLCGSLCFVCFYFVGLWLHWATLAIYVMLNFFSLLCLSCLFHNSLPWVCLVHIPLVVVRMKCSISFPLPFFVSYASQFPLKGDKVLKIKVFI